MNVNKKLIIIGVGVIIVAIVITVLLLMPHGGSSGSTSSSSSNTVEIVYWGLWEDQTIMQLIIDKYEKSHPEVKIVYVEKNFTNYEESLPIRLSEPATPDIVRIHNSWIPMLQPYLDPVPSNIYDKTSYTSTFYPIAYDSFWGTDGNIYAIPLEVDGLLLFYNKDIFQKNGISNPPQDWDEFIDIATKLTVKSGEKIEIAGAAMGSYNNIKHANEIVALLMLQNNAQFISSDGSVDLSNIRFTSTVQYYTDFITKHGIWSDALDNDVALFAEGKVAMIFAPSWRVFNIKEANGELNFGVAPPPQLPANGEDVNLGTFWGEAVSKNSKHKEIAWDFIQFMSQPENLQLFYNAAAQDRGFGEPYSVMSMSGELENVPYVDSVMSIAPSMKKLPLVDYSTWDNIMQELINSQLKHGNIDTQTIKNQQEKLQEIIYSYLK